MRQEIIRLYDDYTHERLGRRVFMDRLAALAGGTAAASALLPMLKNNYAKAAIVAPDDARVTTEEVTFPGANGEVSGYLAGRPTPPARCRRCVVIHENRGLNPHIEDVARRMALEGFVALAPDFLSPLGGTPDGRGPGARDDRPARSAPDRAERGRRGRLPQGSRGDHRQGRRGRLLLGRRASPTRSRSTRRTSPPRCRTTARQPASEDAAKIQAPLLLQYAGLDERINAGIADYEKALKAAGVDYTIYIYEGANHAFNNDTNEARYDKAAADLAWSRTIEFLKQHLARLSAASSRTPPAGAAAPGARCGGFPVAWGGAGRRGGAPIA